MKILKATIFAVALAGCASDQDILENIPADRLAIIDDVLSRGPATSFIENSVAVVMAERMAGCSGIRDDDRVIGALANNMRNTSFAAEINSARISQRQMNAVVMVRMGDMIKSAGREYAQRRGLGTTASGRIVDGETTSVCDVALLEIQERTLIGSMLIGPGSPAETERVSDMLRLSGVRQGGTNTVVSSGGSVVGAESKK